MHFFIQGDSGIGKSYLLREVLFSYYSNIEGFTVQRLHHDDSERTSFCATLFDGQFPPLDGRYAENQRGLFLSPKGKNVAILEKTMETLKHSIQKESCKLILLDEIGGFELESDNFMNSLYYLLESGKPCIGVLKSRKNLNRTLKHFDISSPLETEYLNLQETIKQNGVLHTMTAHHYKNIKKELIDYLKRKI